MTKPNWKDKLTDAVIIVGSLAMWGMILWSMKGGLERLMQ